ncbi:MAG: hypothetical protein UR98_C0001G0090 [Parcubacteria group bacterium GW2011_GWA1_36_12]|nr:MAG: hypothetical protein UR98_C0001G0090 [Parcubacteria group bacterium GW2011_GWA1_36_12]
MKIPNFKLKIDRLTVLVSLFIFAASLYLFYQSLNYYFFQDDWFVLNMVKVNSFGDFAKLFFFRGDIVYWRPVGMQMFFFLSQKIFGLNPIFFHLISYTFLVVSLVLIFKLVRKLTSPQVALIAAFLYAVSSFHYMTFGWLSLTWNFIGLFFFLSSTLIIMKCKTISEKKYLACFFLFLLSLASTEFALIFPLFIIFIFLFKSQNLTKGFHRIVTFVLPFIIVDLFYIVARGFIFNTQTSAEYAFNLTPRNIIGNGIWYLLWFFNIPELFKSQTILTKFYLTENLARATSGLTFLIFFFLIIEVTLFIVIVASNYKKLLIMSLGLLSFFIALAPVIFLANHSYPYYLTIPSLFLLITIASAIEKISENGYFAKVLILTFLIFWFSSSYLSTKITQKNHWITQEATFSKMVAEQIVGMYPNLPKNSTIVISDVNYQLKQSLMDQNLAQVLYNDKTIRTIYESGSDYSIIQPNHFLLNINEK